MEDVLAADRDHVVSGWQRKHAAIAAAALALIARDGYERTSVDAIAAEAGVSKRTVYSHYGDKENLFLLAARKTYDVMRDRVGDIVNRTLLDIDDVEESLTACIREIVRTITRAPERATLITMDVSFISVTKVLPAIVPLASAGADFLILIKPQFELEKREVGKGGIVRDNLLHQKAIERVTAAAAELSVDILGVRASHLTGAQGNQEFFLHARVRG